ncbi:Uncharacterised protein [uncultured archaeon]|nr:Uncharacterised protein [uncultured archaeon]
MELIVSRPVLADKLQVHISPDFVSIDQDDELYYDGYLSPFFEKDIQNLYGGKIVRFDNRPYFQIPNDFNVFTSCFMWNTRFSLRKPFTVAVDYNFIRKLIYCISQDPDFHFDKDYVDSIQLHDDNFIDNSHIWMNWDDHFISALVSNLNKEFLEFADVACRYLIPDYDFIYSIVSLKHAEFNIDFYVGSQKSLPLILAFSRFVSSDRGLAWRSEIESISMLQYYSDKPFNRAVTHQDGSDGHTFKFFITKGLSLKVYQKTTDHIRLELVFDGSFIKQRFHVWSFERVYPELYKFAQDFFKEINFEGILYLLSKETYNGSFICDFIDRFDPALGNVINSIYYNQPISDSQSVSKICSTPRLKRLFKSTMDAYGHRVYSYSPFHYTKRYKRLGPPKKLSPNKCTQCKSFYRSDLKICPYCHDVSQDSGFKDFMTKVNQSKEGGSIGF